MDKVQAASNSLPELPTIVLVPGAWHSPVHYELLFSQLRLSGYPIISDRLPSCGSTHPKLKRPPVMRITFERRFYCRK